MAHRASDVRHDIEDTRAAMTEKLVMLEERIRETVAGAQTSVEEIVEDVGGIVENVKTTVDTTLTAVRQSVAGAQTSVEEIVEDVKGIVGDTVATVQRTFDLPMQVEQHPWPMVGGALLVGYMLGSCGGGHPSAPGPTAERGADVSRPSPSASRAPSAHPQPQQGLVRGLVEQLQDEMQDEIVSLKSAAVGAVISTLRTLFKQAMPTLAPHIESAMSKRGGPPSDSPAQHPAPISNAAVNGARLRAQRQ